MTSVYGSLKSLPTDSQQRVLDYVSARLGLSTRRQSEPDAGSSFSPRELAAEEAKPHEAEADNSESAGDDELAGVSPVARKWIRRNGLTAKQLSSVFSLGLDEIDVVARSVPGASKREKMRNVLLLTGTAAYLGSGAARTDDAGLREALSHYNAYDRPNFATYMKEFAADASGSKENGYTLTARGLAAAAELVAEMTAKK